ncbi:hypothetical protein RRG08_007599 [Elysia crispata]|uniref:Uncharacterized protein n=1 Tax=Elysia crispata TaxID=231223 RepID=A0AAE0YJ07_9GAST|nr:hypothetical protein RRG08_007599 [Elysia crispata]
MFRYILLVCLLIQVSRAIVCTKQLCDGVQQPPLNCAGNIIKNGGFCGCTDVCAKVKGEPCGPTELFLRSPSPPIPCDTGLSCRNGICA